MFSFGLVGAACSGDEDGGDGSPAARINSFEADPPTVVEGESTELRWSTSGASTIRIIADGVLLDLGTLPKEGAVEVAPRRATTYRLEAVGSDGVAVQAQADVAVEAFGPPIIESFVASPTTLRRGETATLSWQVVRADSVELMERTGRSIATVEGETGSAEVKPTRTTAYVLRASNANGVSSAEVEVGVGEPPVVTLASSADVTDYETTISLTWTVEDADSVVVRDPTGAVLHEGPGENGEIGFSAVHSGAYTAVATGPGGEATASAFVAIRPVVEGFTATVQGVARPGSLALLEWEVRGAQAVEIRNSGGASQTFDTATTSASMPLGTGGGFTLRAISGSIVTEAATPVETVEEPLIRALTTSGLVTAGQGQTGIATVAWEIDGAATIQLEVEPGGRIDLTDKSPRRDEVDVVFVAPGTIRLTATNPAGSTVRVIESPVDPVPTIHAFYAAPSRVGSGEAVEIHWETQDAQTVILEMDGVELPVSATLVSGSHPTPVLSAESTYVLRAFNGLGFEVQSAPLTVQVGAPNILSFVTADGRSLYPAGTTIEFLWENDGGSSMSITDSETGQEVCGPTEWTVIRKGSCLVQLPDEQAFKTFVLTVTNASGSDSQSLDIGAVTGPIVTEFTADRLAITEGEMILFSWLVEEDVDGNVPTLTLVDQNGTEYPVDDADPIEGSKRFQIPTWGDYTFTLTAESSIPPAYSLDLDVTVYGIPVIGDIAANPTFAEDEGDPIDVSWTSTHGASMEIFALDRQGNVGASLYSSNTKSQVDAGTATVMPTIDEPNVRLVVRNPLGTPSHKDFRIGVNPATIDYFTADRYDVLLGEEVTLSWGTSRGTDVELDGYIDLTDRPNAVDLNLYGAGDTGLATIQFPSGFAFPYDGGLHTAATVSADGWISFTPNAANACCNVALPSTSANQKAIDLMPFWDDLHTSRNTPNGTILWEYVADPSPHIVVQWKNLGFFTTSRNPADLNFQVILYENGNFEYRYGRMFGQSNYANGQDATIATQNREGTIPNVLLHNQAWADGLSNKGLFFTQWDAVPAYTETTVAPTGTRTFTPTTTRTYTLRTWNGHSDDQATVTVRVHSPAELSAWFEPAEPAPGEPVTLRWQTTNATSVAIEDGNGTLIHTAAPEDLQSGSFDLGALTEGIYDYTIRVVGMLPHDTVTESLVLSVHDGFSLDSFTASESLIKVIDPPVTLSWVTTNATSATITELPGGVVHTIPTAELASGSMQVSPQRTTTYVLEVESHQRIRQDEVVVEVRTVWIDDFSASTTTIAAGGDVTLGWTSTPGGTITLEPELGLIEVSSAFEDISAVGVSLFNANADTNTASVLFPAGFSFPYYGETYNSVSVAIDGVVSFDSALTSVATNQTIPNTSASYQRQHLPIFWDDLHTGANGRVYAAYLPNPDRFIVQWTNFHRYAPTGNRNWDLNFQVVLFPDGSFEYRYGTMAAPPGGTSSTNDCNPVHCEDEANGSSATIGYQAPGGNDGVQFHYGGASSTNAPPFPGGLANRSFAFLNGLPNGNGSITVSPTKPTTYVLCIEDSDWRECHEIPISVVDLGSVQITEFMAAPNPGEPTWVEVRNVLPTPVNLNGWVLETTGGAATIVGDVTLQPGEYLVLGSSAAGGVNIGYEYGNLPMDPTGDTLALSLGGSPINEITWDASWNVSQGQSLELDPIFQRAGVGSRSEVSEFCLPSMAYTGTSFGTPGLHGQGCSPGGFAYQVETLSDAPLFDISTTGQELLTTFTSQTTVNLSFSFPFFSDVTNVIGVTSTGFVGIQAVNHVTSNASLPTSGLPGTTGLIAPFWEYASFSRLGATVSWEERIVGGQSVAIFQWMDFSPWDGVSADAIDFQLQLWENGDIVFGYTNLRGSSGLAHGSSATIGIQEAGANPAFLQYSYNEESIFDGQVIKFEPLP